MKWFKFIIYFQLIYTGISCCFQFFVYLGLEQLVDTLQQYNLGSLISGFALFESTVFTALISGALAVLAFYTRSRLARFKEDGPKFFLIFHGAGAARLLLEWISISSYCDKHGYEFDGSATYVGQLIGVGVMMALSYNYFQKRDYLFTE